MYTKAKRRIPDCRNFKQCGRTAASAWATLCRSCFLDQAARSGKQSSGNANGSPGNAGNANGSPGNAGNATGSPGNAGNKKVGVAKKSAGIRSGTRRSSKTALVVKKVWLDKILAGRKKWEIRGHATDKRGWIHFAESKAGGKLVGRARLVGCQQVPKSSFMNHYRKHQVHSLSQVPYKTIHAWILDDAERFAKPFVYKHRQGAVIWVSV